MVSFVKGFM